MGSTYKEIKMNKIQYLTILLFVFVTPAFSALVDIMPMSGEAFVILMPFILFSFIGLVRFVAHFWKDSHFRTVFFITTSLFTVCAIISCVVAIYMMFFYDVFRTLVIISGIAMITGVPIGLIYVFKKRDKFIAGSIWYIIGITAIFIIAALNIEHIACFFVVSLIVLMCLLIVFFCGALEIISLIWLIKLLIKKIK